MNPESRISLLDWLDLGLVAFAMVLLGLPMVAPPGLWLYVSTASIAPFAVSITAHLVVLPAVSSTYALRRRKFLDWLFNADVRWLVAALLVYSLICGIASFRGYLGGRLGLSAAVYNASNLTLVSIFGMIVIGNPATPTSIRQRTLAITMAALVFIGVNLFLFALGIDPPESMVIAVLSEDPASMLGALGLNLPRIAFPLASGFNTFGVAASTVVGAGIVFLMRSKFRIWPSLLGLAAVILGIGGILGTDTRAAAVGALAAGIVGAVFPWELLRYLRYCALLQIVAPVSALALGAALSLIDPAWLPTRGGADLLTLNSRATVWAATVAEAFSPRPIHLVGFGFEGPQVSNVIYSGWDVVGMGFDIEHMTVHNSLFQHFLDVGYVGAFLLVGVSFIGLRRTAHTIVSQARELAWRVAAAIVIALLVGGVTASIPHTTTPELTALLFWALMLARLAADKDPRNRLRVSQ